MSGGRPRSLLRSIVLSLSLTTLTTIAIGCGWFFWRFEAATQDFANSTVVSRSEALAARLRAGPDGVLSFSLPEGLASTYATPGDGHHFAIRGEDGAVLFGSPEPAGRPPRIDPNDENGTLYQSLDDTARPTHRYGVARQVTIGTRTLVLQVEESASHQQALIRALLEDIIEGGGWMLPLLLLPLAVALLTVRRALEPLTALSAQAATIGPATTDVRLPGGGVPSEIVPLVDAVNSALDRLADGFKVQRDFTAGAAHELRTPLAVLMAQVDALPAAEGAMLRPDIEAMAHLVQQLLRVAQLEALDIRTDERTDLNAVAAEVVGFLAPLALRRGKEIGLAPAPAPVLVRGSAEAINHALRNLADNALAHTAPGSEVTVSVGDEPAIAVRDHGPGVPADQRERIFERFWRADRRTSGAGLGLAIARRVMELHGGAVTVDDAPGGGAVFTLRFGRRE